MEQWLDPGTKRKPDQRYPLKPKRKEKISKIEAMKPKPPAPPRPGCDIPTRAAQAIAKAKRLAAAREAREKDNEEQHMKVGGVMGPHHPQPWDPPSPRPL